MKAVFDSPVVEVFPFTSATADGYARIRARHRVAPADAIHLAGAATAGVNLSPAST